MNSEQLQQLYGGEISDYIKIQSVSDISNATPIHADQQLESIYNTQVKPKGAINVTSTFLNFDPRNLIENRSEDPIQKAFKLKLNKLAADIGLEGDNLYHTNYTPSLKSQSVNDVQAAKDLVAVALAELKELGAL